MGSVSNEQIFELLQKTSQNVEEIKQDLTNYKEEVDILKESVEELKNENKELKEKLLFQEELLKKKNILAFRIAETDSESLEKIVLDLLNVKLKVNKTINDIDNFYRIGEKRPNEIRPILIKFTRELTVREIFKNVKNLKGTGISVALDLTQEKRAENKILYEFFKIAKEKQFAPKIIRNKLFINNDEYTVDTLKELNRQTFLEPIVDKESLFVNNSAPPTPTIRNKSFEDSCESEEDSQDQITEQRKHREDKIILENKERKPEVKETKPKVGNTKNQNSALQTPKGRTTRSGSTSSNNGNYQHQQKRPVGQKK